MGMDGIEIVMKVEEVFGIAIEDAEAEKILTPRQLIDLIVSKVSRTDQATCLTRRAFHRLRASLMRRLGLKRNEIRPATPLVSFFPRPTRKQQLCEVLNDAGIAKNVELIRPVWLSNSIVAGIFGGGIVVMVLVARYTSFATVNLLASILVGAGFAIFFGCIAMVSTRGQRYEFQPSMLTVGGLSRWVVAHEPHLVQATPGQWSREQVAETVRAIVIDSLGCEKEYREDAEFVKDLDLG
jgi:acyl carrier protein